MPDRGYVPAASLDLLLPLYDPLTRLIGFHRVLRQLLAQATLAPDHEVLDIGCGTGTLAIMIKQLQPAIRVTGLDPDPLALARAARKARRARVEVRFERGSADALPHPDASFDRVFSSMMFHHVRKEQKLNVLADVRRVLRPGGRLEFVDFAGGTHNMLAQILHGRQASASAGARLLQRLAEAGFTEARRTSARGSIAGAIAFYQARAG